MSLTSVPRASLLALVPLAAACGGAASTASTKPAPAVVAEPAPATAPTPPAFRLPGTAAPLAYRAELTLDPDQTEFQGVIEIDVALAEPTELLWLNARDVSVTSASATTGERSVEATPVAVASEDFIGVRFAEPLAAGTVTVRLAYTGTVSDTELSGVFRQKEGGSHYLYTQFEAIDARRAFPCFDEPQYKVPWQLSIRTKADHLALTNTPQLAAETDGGSTLYRFAQTKPLPSYLVAFAVGPFDVVDAGTAGRSATPLRIIVPRGKQAEAAFAVASTGKVLELLETYFDMPYPYAKLDSIAVPSFFGAMENPGLITYSQDIILTPPDELTERAKQGYVGIAAHEIGHQWFGNLVTMQWWDDLWLNESFASWIATKITEQYEPAWDTEVYQIGTRERAMGADQLTTAKAVRQPVEKQEDIFGSSAIFYAKGESVLKHFESWIGEDKFRDGIRAYIAEHAWGNATAADFFAALAKASTPGLAAAFSTFIEQPGYPLVSAKLSCTKGQAPVLELSQARYVPQGAEAGAAQTWNIPVCARYPATGKATGRDCTLMAGPTATLTLSQAQRCPSWVVANDAAAGYYRVDYDDDLLQATLLGAGRSELSTPERIMMIGDVEAMVDSGALGSADAFRMVPTLADASNPYVTRSTAAIVEKVDQHLVSDSLRPNYARFVRKLYAKRARELGWKSKPGEDQGTRSLRPQLLALVAIQGEDEQLGGQARELADAWLANDDAVEPEMVRTVLLIAARQNDRSLYDRLLAQATATEERERRGRLLNAMSEFTEPDLLRSNFALMLGEGFEFREVAPMLFGSLQDPRTRELGYELMKQNVDTILDKLPSFYGRFIVFAAASHCDEGHASEAQSFFGPKVEKIMGGKAALDQVIEQIRVCAARREAQLPGVEQFLKKF